MPSTHPTARRPRRAAALRHAGLVILAAALCLAGTACAQARAQGVAPAPAADPRLSLSEPLLGPRPEEPGAPVDCAFEVGNQSGRTLTRLIVRCELLDRDGRPVGNGLATLTNLPNGQSRAVRTVVYGVRSFASAQARVSSATFQ